MTGWDIADRFIGGFPPIAVVLTTMAILVALVIFIVGFSKHGVAFLKYGFKQTSPENPLEKRFDKLEAEIAEIKTNHFGHLKGFLGELAGILLDKGIISNGDKARLDNRLSGM